MLKKIWKILVYAYDNAWELMIINFLWFICALPAAVTFFVLLYLPDFSLLSYILPSPLIIFPLAAAQAGLYHTVRQLAYGEGGGWRVFLQGIRQYYWASLRWVLLNAVVLGLLVFYILFLVLPDSTITMLVRGISLGVLPWWLLIQVYTFPVMLEQEKPAVLTSLRNSAIVFLKWPGQALVMSLLIYVLIGLSSWLTAPWILFTASLCAYMAAFLVMENLGRNPRDKDEQPA